MVPMRRIDEVYGFLGKVAFRKSELCVYLSLHFEISLNRPCILISFVLYFFYSSLGFFCALRLGFISNYSWPI
jgi:hypothetical protein